MRKLSLITAAGLALAVAAHAPHSLAQSIEFGPGGVRVDPYGEPGAYGRISPREARAIARDEGLVEIDAVSRAGRRYYVEGTDRRGRDMRVEIDARSGDVLRVVRMR